MTAPTSTDVRARLVDTLRRDLIGPGPQDTDLTRERLKMLWGGSGGTYPSLH